MGIFEDSFTLSDTSPRRQYTSPQMLKKLIIYTSVQNCYVGRMGKQDFLLVAINNYVREYALELEDVDISTLIFKAAAANATPHLLGVE